MSRIPDEIAIRAFRVIDVVEQQLADAQDDKKQAYSDLREELKAAGFKGEEISKEVAAFKAGLAQHRRSDADRTKADEREEGAAYYLGIFNSPRARARTREGDSSRYGAGRVYPVTSSNGLGTPSAGMGGEADRQLISSPVNDSGQGEADGAFQPGNHTSVPSAPISHGQPSELAG